MFIFYNERTDEAYQIFAGSEKQAMRKMKKIYHKEKCRGKLEDFHCYPIEMRH